MAQTFQSKFASLSEFKPSTVTFTLPAEAAMSNQNEQSVGGGGADPPRVALNESNQGGGPPGPPPKWYTEFEEDEGVTGGPAIPGT
eukprot:5677597-Amphidinium_carterae.1